MRRSALAVALCSARRALGALSISLHRQLRKAKNIERSGGASERCSWTERRASRRNCCPFFSRNSPAKPRTASSGRMPSLSRNPGSGDPRTRSHSNHYYATPPVGPEPVIHTVRPKMPPRTDSHRSSSRTVPQFYGEVKYSQGFENVSYATNPADLYGSTHHRRGSDERGYYGRSRGEPVY